CDVAALTVEANAGPLAAVRDEEGLGWIREGVHDLPEDVLACDQPDLAGLLASCPKILPSTMTAIERASDELVELFGEDGQGARGVGDHQVIVVRHEDDGVNFDARAALSQCQAVANACVYDRRGAQQKQAL